MRAQNEILKNFDSGLISKNAKSSRKSPLAEVEAKLYEFLTEKTRMGLPINGPLLIEQAKIIHEGMNRMNRKSENPF